jgi:phosphoglycolate phosphatase-like HAD superfamily hydrolase
MPKHKPKKTPKKLALFDIDGTLVGATQTGIEYWKLRLSAVFERVYEIPISFPLNVHDYNGMVDKKLMHQIATKLGISDETFQNKFPQARNVFHSFLKHAVDDKKITYDVIPDAIALMQLLVKYQTVHYGLITGNIEANGWLKLESAGIHDMFTFGVFGDNADERVELVHEAIRKFNASADAPITPADVIVVGDTVHDIHAAKAAGAIALGVASGVTNSVDDLRNAGADLAVSSLMDPTVLTLFEVDGYDHT